MRAVRSSRLTGVSLLVFVVGLLALGLTAVGQDNQANQPTITDSNTTPAIRSELLAVTPKLLSGLGTIGINAGYTFAAGSIPASAAKLYYTLDGSNPGVNSPNPIDLTCAATPCAGVYTGTLSQTQLGPAAAGAKIRFIIELRDVGGAAKKCDPVPGSTGACPPSAAVSFNFTIDKSRPFVDAANSQPPSDATSSFKGGVTTSSSAALRFRVRDNTAESPLDGSTVVVKLDGVDATGKFFRTDVSPHEMRFDLDPATASPPITWTEGVHTVEVTVRDGVKNIIGQDVRWFNFTVDRTAPTVSDIKTKVTPNSTTAGVTYGAKSAAILVTAKIEDKAGTSPGTLNTLGTSNVFAQLFNATNGQITALAPMTFNAGFNRWTADVPIPAAWPFELFGVRARIVAVDMAGNVALQETAGSSFVLDAVAPVVTDPATDLFVPEKAIKVRVLVKEVGAGVDTNKVWLRYSNLTGGFKAAVPATHTKLGPKTFEVKMTAAGGENWTADVPQPSDGTIITYFVWANDKVANNGTTALRTVTVDGKAPELAEPTHLLFRGKSPLAFEVRATDAAAGMNVSSVQLFYNPGGAFKSLTLNRTGGGNVFRGNVTDTLTDGLLLKYYFKAKDVVANEASLGTEAAPLNTTIDLQAPALSITSPATSTGPQFEVALNATDARSGVANSTVEARLADPGRTPSAWITIANGTTSKSLPFCGEGNHTYEFRGYATDAVGNAGTLPANAQSTTRLTGSGCAESVTVLVSPVPSVNAGSTSTAVITYDASPTRSFTPREALTVDVDFSPDDGQHFYRQLTRGENTGTYDLRVAALPSCSKCIVRVTAYTLTNASASHSVSFTITNGSPLADLDANGLSDSWELRYGQRLGQFDPAADEDGDGLSTSLEDKAGSSPRNRDTDGDGFSDEIEYRSGTSAADGNSRPTRAQARTEEFTPLYWAVPGLFLLVGVVFFVALARRW